MNINNKFIEEAKAFELRFKQLPKFSRAVTASMLECQRLHNETGKWDCCDECKEKAKKESNDN